MIRQVPAAAGLTLLILSSSLQGCISTSSLFGSSRGPVETEVIIPAKSFFTTDEILVLDLTGTVSIGGRGGFFSGPGMLVQLKDRMNAAERNRRLRAVILRIDSPGGGVTASDVIYHELVEFKKRMKIPVIAMMQDVAASGGLYIAMAADEIYALPTTLTGSIGVIMMLPGFTGLSEKLGFEMRVIKSGENKDTGSMWRDLSDSDREFFQAMIDSMYARFLDVIMEGRGRTGLTRERLEQFADGRVLEGTTAAELGLIDGVAYTDEVIERVKELAHIDDARIISYEYPYGYRGNIYARGSTPRPKFRGLAAELNLIKVDLGLDGLLPTTDARFLYMWLP